MKPTPQENTEDARLRSVQRDGSASRRETRLLILMPLVIVMAFTLPTPLNWIQGIMGASLLALVIWSKCQKD